MKKNKGFSLIELLIVVAIILIIAAIAIPNLMRARMAANDSSAAASEHTIVVGQVGYLGAYPANGYATLLQLGGGATPCIPAPATGCLIDNNLATNGAGNGKSGYTFTVVPGGTALTGWNFYTTAAPLSNVTGTKAFCAGDDGVVRNAAPGVIAAPAGYAACLALTPMNN
jgi:type IV pilus assembly protein PilA